MKAAVRALAPLAVLSAMAMAGCAQDVGDIVRVQPNFVKKSDFEGQWYIRNTFAEVPPQVEFGFVGSTLQMEKICWEVTENHLIGFRSYELYPGKNPAAEQVAEGECWKEAPVVAYPIEKHFDIQRQYNSATGEQTNVITENTSDRPWYDRAFMRVDWSQNHVEDYTSDLGSRAAYSGAQFDFSEYVQSYENNEWSFRMEDAAGVSLHPDVEDPEVFTKLFAEGRPAVNYMEFTQQVTLAPPTYHVGWNGKSYAIPGCAVGGYNTLDCASGQIKVRTSILRVPEAKTFEPRVYDDSRMQKFGFFRTTRQSYDDHYGHTDAGRTSYANIHNIWKTAYAADGSLLPPRDREAKPIVYALSANYPAALVGEAEETARGWSKALTRTVAAAQGRTFEQVFADFPFEDAEGNYLNTGLFRLDYNEDGHARIGDLRYNFIYYVDGPHQYSPLGYGPSSSDPQTGEVIAAQAYMYGAALESYAQHALDIVKVLNGDLTTDEHFTSGEYMREYLQQARGSADPLQLVTNLEIPETLNRPVEDLRLENVSPSGALQLEALKQFGMDAVQESFSTQMARLEGTPLQSAMINDEIRGVLAAQTGSLDVLSAPADADLLELARPLTLGLEDSVEPDELRQIWALNNNVWLADYSDATVEGLARYLAQQDWTEEEMFEWVRSKIFRAVTEHEVGHTLGLRHNFQGSYDSINFFPEYWDLRKQNVRDWKTEIQSMGDVLSMATLTPEQVDGRMREYEYSSIMDYGARFNTDFHGLGSYDEAAILFGYADYVEYFNEVGDQFKSRYFSTFSDGTPRFEEIGSLGYDQLLDVSHYTQMPYLMGDGNLELGLARFEQRSVMPYETLRSMREEGFSDRPVEVPYMFCSDDWVDAINSCLLWDQGADLLEQTRSVIEQYKNEYWFTNFRRNRAGWTPYKAYQRSYGRILKRLPNFYIHWLFKAAYGQYDDGSASGDAASLYSELAVYDGVNLLMDIVTTPAYGTYEYDEAANAYRYGTSVLDAEGGDLTVPMGEGRRSYTRYDYGSGYYYFLYPQEAGHFWDYMSALTALATSRGTFRGVEVQSNFTEFNLPYYVVFGEDLARRFNAIVTNEPEVYAPRLATLTNGDSLVVGKPLVDYMGLFSGSQPQLPSDLATVEPELNYTDRFYALLYGVMGFRRNDTQYIDQHRVFRLGTGETLDPAATWEVRRFDSEDRGVVYAALAKVGAAEQSAAVTMVERANALQAERAQALAAGDEAKARSIGHELTAVIDWMDLQRSVYDIFGRAL